MNHSQSPNLISPSGHIHRSPLSPNPHDSNSNYSELFAAGGDSNLTFTSTTSTSTNDHDNHIVPKKKNFKTEYKSKFTPFDQYVYNEVTDSFVKHSLESSINHGQNRTVSNSKSNQDLACNENLHRPTLSISAQRSDVFSPSAEGTNDNYANNEPWYKEVVRRNEKANEYRFKSEIGHNSPLSNYNNSTTNATNNLRVESPCNTERQMPSPTGVESIVGDLLATSDARSQCSDPQNELVGSQQEPKQQFKFTPSDYKHDHLISHMANNNNFNLPREQSEQSTTNKLSSRHTQVSSSARAASRTGAQARSRSQSTRRQPLSATPSSTIPTSKCQTSAKSNQTTPTRTVAARTTARSHITSTLQTTGAKSPVKNTQVNSRFNSARPTTASPRTVTNLKATPKEPVKRSSISSSTKTTTTRSTKSTSATSNKTTPSSTEVKRATTTVTRVASAPRPTAPKTANTSGISPVHSHKTNVSSPSTRISTTAISSKNKSTEASKPSPSLVAQNNTVKSIKTPKAVASTKQVGVTIASAVAAAVTTTATVLATSPKVISEQILDNEINDTTSKLAFNQDSSREPQPIQKQLVSSNQAPLTEMQTDNNDGSNQIFSLKESGNMLSDELAEAERATICKTKTGSFERQATSSENKAKIENSNSATREVEKINEGLNSSELINGLAGGLVSAEDRFDSPEKEISSDIGTNIQQLGCDNNLYNHHDADEPYSIMPTTSQRIEAFIDSSFSDVKTNSEIHQEGESNAEKSQNENIQIDESQNTLDIKEMETKDELETNVLEQPKNYSVNDLKRHQSSASINSLSDKVDDLELSPKSEQKLDNLSERRESRKDLKEENDVIESAFEKLNLNLDKSSGNEDQAISSSHEVATLHEESQSTNHGREIDFGVGEQQNQVQDENSNEDVVDYASDKDENIVNNYALYKESDNEDSPALVEDIEQRELSSPKRQKLSESPKKLEGGKDFTESGDLNDSTPALASANTTLQEAELNAFATYEDTSIAEVPYNKNDSNNTNTNLVQETLDEAETNLHDDISSKQLQHEQISPTKQHELFLFEQSANKDVVESDGGDLEENMNRNELLMNVTDLIESESRKKLEMARKSEIARQNISPQPPSEILLSANQLTEQSNERPKESHCVTSVIKFDELRQHGTEVEEHNREDGVSSSSEKPSLKIENIPSNSTNLELSSAKMGGKSGKTSSIESSSHFEDVSDQEDDDSKSDKHIVNAFEGVGHKEMDVNAVSENLSNVDINDDIDNDEQLKLSNPLTNSDDELILQPRNYNYSSPRYNEGFGLEMMAQEEDRLNGSVELSDGSSAAIEQPTVAENRLQMLALKSIVPEISQTSYLFSHTEDSDEEVVDVLDSEKDLIDAEATIGYTANVDKDELLRFNEVKEKIFDQPDQGYIHDGKLGEILPAPQTEKYEGEPNKDLMKSAEPIVVTSDTIDGTVKQIHGELYRQLNKSQEERRYSSGLDEQALRRQYSSDSSSSSLSSTKIKNDDSKSEYDEFSNRVPASITNPKSENNNTTLSLSTNFQNEESVLSEPNQSDQIESSGTVKTTNLLD